MITVEAKPGRLEAATNKENTMTATIEKQMKKAFTSLNYKQRVDEWRQVITTSEETTAGRVSELVEKYPNLHALDDTERRVLQTHGTDFSAVQELLRESLNILVQENKIDCETHWDMTVEFLINNDDLQRRMRILEKVAVFIDNRRNTDKGYNAFDEWTDGQFAKILFCRAGNSIPVISNSTKEVDEVAAACGRIEEIADAMVKRKKELLFESF